jgi:hypothetical protein
MSQVLYLHLCLLAFHPQRSDIFGSHVTVSAICIVGVNAVQTFADIAVQ